MRIVIAGGGTGGHLFPGIAIAQEFMRKDPDNRVLFVGTGKPFEVEVLDRAGFPHHRIASEGIKGRKLWQKAAAVWKVPGAILASIGILWKFKPDLVIGVGGYSAGPVATGAWLMRKKIALQEQNLLPGITNRMLAAMADRIFVSFEESTAHFDAGKVRVSGNPVREEVRRLSEEPPRADRDKPFTVLIAGGSQGAHGINTAVIDALEYIREKDRIRFIHQTGKKDEQDVQQSYLRHGIPCTAAAFFMDMPSRMEAADLVICRAGATTVAEIAAMGKAAIFVPFPHAADNHQVLNARALEAAGAAEMILEKDLSGRSLADRIEYYRTHRSELSQMAEAAGAHGRPQAAAEIVEECYRLVAEEKEGKRDRRKEG
ncbi:MAG: undecaprenyldiphospho-muramoylpentapeptide beta-N-acetylglucosaminyltransferase [Desulfobacteraceae bacterium]|nr:MAG: undecaprenyldiphospho-muramoylpentapeptide beta-N-acetylglucosaminyltransferase [Desulfobacteraceae bacterium]